MPERFLTFRVNGELYALPADRVGEVIRLPAVARVPQAPKGLLGLANLRGNVLPVASVRGLLGVEEAAEATTRAIVLDGAAPVALAVDVVEALVAVEAGQIERRQAELAARPGERLKGAFAADGKRAIAKILDIEGLIGAAFAQEARTRPRWALAGAGAADKASVADDRQMLVSFDVAGQEYAFALDVVLEILDAPETLAALPASEALVLGVTPFRDTLLPLLSLRGLLGFDGRAERADREKIVVAKVGGALVGLLADRMRTIFPADADLIEKIPSVLSARAGGEAKISAIYRGENGRRLVSVLAPEQLFREDVMQRLKAGVGSTEETDKQAPRRQGEERQFLVFRLGEDEFGLPIEAVDEVARVPEQITRLPKTPKFLEGVVNLRGDVLPVVDQRRRFDMPALEERGGRRLVVVRTERHRAGLIVDAVSEVLRCYADDIEPAPDLSNEAVKLVDGVINLETAARIVLLLDPAELLTRAERGLLDAFQATAGQAKDGQAKVGQAKAERARL
jgi:purine-binding chemotaxis protein CheW